MDRMWNFKGCFARTKEISKKKNKNHKKKRWIRGGSFASEKKLQQRNRLNSDVCINVLIEKVFVQTTQISFYFYSFG